MTSPHSIRPENFPTSALEVLGAVLVYLSSQADDAASAALSLLHEVNRERATRMQSALPVAARIFGVSREDQR